MLLHLNSSINNVQLYATLMPNLVLRVFATLLNQPKESVHLKNHTGVSQGSEPASPETASLSPSGAQQGQGYLLSNKMCEQMGVLGIDAYSPWEKQVS